MSISGKYAEAKIGGMAPVFISGNYQWSVEETAQELDKTTAEDAGYSNTDDGIYSATVELSGYLDLADGDYTAIRRGTLISNLKLYIDKDDATASFVFATAKVFRSTMSAEVNGKVEWRATIKNQGTYTFNEQS